MGIITEFTPFASLIGGGLIGLSAVLLMLLLGRIAGLTGIITGIFFPPNTQYSHIQERSWRISFIIGAVAAVWLLEWGFSMPVQIDVPVNNLMLIGGGLLVGIGVTLGGGCTSGHGICGLARRSKRSLVAVLCFMGAAFVTVYMIRHVIL